MRRIAHRISTYDAFSSVAMDDLLVGVDTSELSSENPNPTNGFAWRDLFPKEFS